mmetsp:Transcript_6424/g.10156  ORF Transcript_6424/g.10156 Transcript_6424/m.10156 type:complete len:262 (+) Transcript_6424:326-1111(+)
MTCRTKCLAHTFICASEHIRAGAHSSANEHRLSNQLIVDRYQRMMRWKCTCRTFAMHQQFHEFAIHVVLLNLCNIVRHIVDHMHVQVVRRRAFKNLLKRLTRQECHTRTVHPGKIRRCRHGCQIVLAFLTRNECTRQLSIVDVNLVALHGCLHLHQRIGRHLMAQAARATVDHDTNLILGKDAHLLGRKLIVDLVDSLNFNVVVACAQCTHLWQSAFLGTWTHFGGVCAQHPSVLLAVLFIFGPRISLANAPVHAHLQRRH